MKNIILTIAAVVSLAGCSAFPGLGAKATDEHAAHHPGEVAARADASKIDEQMKSMQDMHQRMVNAKTPAERAALMKEHMSAMQGGMAMMGKMRGDMTGKDGGGSAMSAVPPMHRDMMQRMEMMEMMMQMMMDREAARSPSPR